MAVITQVIYVLVITTNVIRVINSYAHLIKQHHLFCC